MPISVWNYKIILFSGLHLWDVFLLNKPNMLNFSRNVLRGFCCSLHLLSCNFMCQWCSWKIGLKCIDILHDDLFHISCHFGNVLDPWNREHKSLCVHKEVKIFEHGSKINRLDMHKTSIAQISLYVCFPMNIFVFQQNFGYNKSVHYSLLWVIFYVFQCRICQSY